MDYRQLGRSGLKVSALSLGTMTFGGKGMFAKTGATDVAGARRQIDLCLEAGINLFDTADVYSDGLSEEILGKALEGRRDDVLIATKARFCTAPGVNDAGSSRFHLIAAIEASLRRLRTDHIDLYQLHQWDGMTPLEETLEALDTLVRSGKVRYVGVSNFSAWHLMKTLAVAEAQRFVRPVSQQIHYTLQAREAEYELVPATLDQGVGILVWSPLAGGLLSGKYRRGHKPPEGTRQLADWGEPPVHDQEKLYDIVEVLVGIAEARGVSAAQVALAWLARPAGGDLGGDRRTDGRAAAGQPQAADLVLTAEEIDRLDEASAPPLLYPYWHQASTAVRPPVARRSVAHRAAPEVDEAASLAPDCGEQDVGTPPHPEDQRPLARRRGATRWPPPWPPALPGCWRSICSATPSRCSRPSVRSSAFPPVCRAMPVRPWGC